MIKKLASSAVCAAGTTAFALTVAYVPAVGQSFTPSEELQAKIDSHPHVRQLTTWGGRQEWSFDSKRLIFTSKALGDLFEVDVVTGKTKPLSFHFSHAGILRGYYLKNGDILFTAPKVHYPGPGMVSFDRVNRSELWYLKGDLSGPPIPLNERNLEGVAVSRTNMRIAWSRLAKPAARPQGWTVPRALNAGEMASEIWMADIAQDRAGVKLVNKKKLLDCSAANSSINAIAAQYNSRCLNIEAQNFVPGDENRLTLLLTMQGKTDRKTRLLSFIVNVENGVITPINTGSGYAEVEGVFPDGKSTLVEYSPETEVFKATPVIDLWRAPLDGSGKLQQLTRYNSIDSRLKSNQGVVSPDGKWLAFNVATGEIEKVAGGQGIGIFIMDLTKAVAR